MEDKTTKHILWFSEINKDDGALVGGKNASLGEMYNQLNQQGVRVPNGFALTAGAYWYFLKFNHLDEKLAKVFSQFNRRSLVSLAKTGQAARQLILQAKLPPDLAQQIKEYYRELSEKSGRPNITVAVRSSATAEDLKGASFAGAMETYLNITGEANFLIAVRKCISSLFTDRSIAYREEKGFDHLKIALSVGVLQMVRSDLGSSGIMFTLDTETGFRNVVLINSIYGVGEMIVKGHITPDEFIVFKPGLKDGFRSIVVKNLGQKKRKYVFRSSGGLKEEPVALNEQKKFSINDDDILTLAKWAVKIEEHYNFPQDIEWAKDGKTGELFILQSRPETVETEKKDFILKEFVIKNPPTPLLQGIAIGGKVASGKARVIKAVSQLPQFERGEILITKMTDPNWVPAIRLASAVITDEGSRVCFSGDTKILTNKGFLTIKEIVENIKENKKLQTLSFNKEKMVLEWKRIADGFQKHSNLIRVGFSQTGRMKDNYVESTPDHKFLTFQNRDLISKEIKDIIKDKEGVISVYKIPQLSTSNLNSKKAYLLGAIFTDGCISLRQSGSTVSFIQKPTKEKEQFINQVKRYFFDIYKYDLHPKVNKPTTGVIRGKPIFGSGAMEFRCFKKEIANDFKNCQRELANSFLGCSEEALFNFLGGVIDGDGTYNEKANRINIFCSKHYLFEAIVLACLRLGINFQVVPNRDIKNIQIVDKIEEIFRYTARVKGNYERVRFGVKFFFARQLLEDIGSLINYKGRIMPYIKNNLLIDSEKIRNFVIPMIKGAPENHSLTSIIDSPLKMARAYLEKEVGEDDVFNIEVEGNHNYMVFSSRGTPVLVDNCHAAIVSRELGIPCVVGTAKASKVLRNGQMLTVDCSSGLKGNVYPGKVLFETKEYNLKEIPSLPTKIMVNIGEPGLAFKTSFLPVDGVGLAREEFIIAEKIRVHPMALYDYEKLKIKSKKLSGADQVKLREIIKKIDKITVEHQDKKEFFVKELAEGVGQIATAFWPKPVILRFSDFKTNEYRALVGGELYEPLEQNPMIGWRGASRYYDEKFKPAFLMECEAVKRVRDVFGLKNLKLMIPFCRTVEEGKKVIEIMRQAGLEQGKDGLEVYVMCEIPSNVIMAEQFLEIFDGMSIGSNDLTQLTLGLDRDNSGLSYIGNENNEAVKELLKKVIQVCREKGKHCGICGDAPSSFPDFANFLMDCGIESISLSPDAVIKTILQLSSPSSS